MTSFDFDLLRKNGRARLIAARVVDVDSLENRGNAGPNLDALASEPRGKIGRWSCDVVVVVLLWFHSPIVPVLFLFLHGCHDEMRGCRSTRERVGDVKTGRALVPSTVSIAYRKLETVLRGDEEQEVCKTIYRSQGTMVQQKVAIQQADAEPDPQLWRSGSLQGYRSDEVPTSQIFQRV